MQKTKDELLAAQVRALKKLTEMSDLPGYPADPDKLKPMAKMIARMCVNGPVTHDKFGWQIDNDIDWLIERVAANSERYPTRGQIRDVYVEYFPPQDGIEMWTK